MLLANFNGKEHLRHRAVSLRQHGFLVSVNLRLWFPFNNNNNNWHWRSCFTSTRKLTVVCNHRAVQLSVTVTQQKDRLFGGKNVHVINPNQDQRTRPCNVLVVLSSHALTLSLAQHLDERSDVLTRTFGCHQQSMNIRRVKWRRQKFFSRGAKPLPFHFPSLFLPSFHFPPLEVGPLKYS